MSNTPGGGPPYGGFPSYPSYPPGWYAPAADPLVPPDLGGWFDRSFRVFRRSFWRLTLIAVIVGGGGIAAGALLIFGVGGTNGSARTPVATVALVTGMLVVFAAFAAAQGASIYLAVMDAAGRRAPIGEALRAGARRMFPLLGWYLLANAVMIVGFLLLIVPGIYLAVVLNASIACVVVIERTDITRCFDLVRGRFWATFGRLLLGWLLTQVIPYLAMLVLLIPFMVVFSVAPPGRAGVGATIVLALMGVVAVAAFLFPYIVASTALTVVTYAELRGHDDGATTERLADELARP